MVDGDGILSADVRDHDTWDMIFFFEYVEKRRKRRRRCK